MQIKFISYGQKFYEAEGKEPPKHDNLFNLRDIDNPFWDEKLKPHIGLEKPIIEFFESKENVQNLLKLICNTTDILINGFINNKSRQEDDSLTFAFRCTGGKHRSVYFAQSVYDYIRTKYADIIEKDKLKHTLEFSIDHLELYRYQNTSQGELATK